MEQAKNQVHVKTVIILHEQVGNYSGEFLKK